MQQSELYPSTTNLNRLKTAVYLRYLATELLTRNPDDLAAQKFQTIMNDFILAAAVRDKRSTELLNCLIEDLDTFLTYQQEKQGPSGVLIGTVGYENAGKGEISKTLVSDFGFQAHTLSDRLRDVAAIKGTFPPYDRDYLYNLSKESKAVFGRDYLIWVTAFLFYQPDQPNRMVIDGLRNIDEAVALRTFADNNQVVIVAVLTDWPEQPVEDDLIIRYLRSLDRGSDKDPKQNTEENFLEFERLSKREARYIKETIDEQSDLQIANRPDEQEATRIQLEQGLQALGIFPLAAAN